MRQSISVSDHRLLTKTQEMTKSGLNAIKQIEMCLCRMKDCRRAPLKAPPYLRLIHANDFWRNIWSDTLAQRSKAMDSLINITTPHDQEVYPEITKEKLKDAMPQKRAIKITKELLKDRIVVGHTVKHDL